MHNWKEKKEKADDDEEIKFCEIFHAPFMIVDDSYNIYKSLCWKWTDIVYSY